MIFFDSIILGFYWILGSTMYRNKDGDGFGAKEHSLLFSWVCHSLNLQLISNQVSIHFFDCFVPFYLVVTLSVFVLVIQYLVYIYRGGFKRLARRQYTLTNKVGSMIFAASYLGVLIYFYLV